MAEERLLALRNDPQLARFVLQGRPTGVTLGAGSYGSVEEIEVNGLPCAGKRLHELLLDFDNVGIENIALRYIQECQLMSDFRHPNIAQFLGVCFLPDSKLPILLTELLDDTLHNLLESIPNIPLVLKRSMLEDVAKGLTYLHNHQPPIVHRDLTARNVLLSTSFVAKLTDFGNSRVIALQPGHPQYTLTGFPGNLLYMSPEAMMSQPCYGPSLDIFSYGHLSLFTLLQVFPCKLLAPVCQHPSMHPGMLIARSEVERRAQYFDQLEKISIETDRIKHLLIQLVTECLCNSPLGRPTAEQLVTALAGIKSDIEGSNGELATIDAVRQVKMMRIKQSRDELAAKEEEIQQQLHVPKVNKPCDVATSLSWKLERGTDNEWVVLGRGTYGIVYKAFCTTTGKDLAVKVVSQLTKQAADELEKEVEQLSKLSPHKRVVTYFGASYDDHPKFSETDCLFVFTEFMPGGSLSSRLKQRGPFSKALTLNYTRQILEGVEYLHRCGVIHRDIKGSNILCDTSGNVKLADFGSAKQIFSESLDKDKTTYLCGTAPWAAPEVLKESKAQTESDIWSVGATVVEMLTGGTPYKEENFKKIFPIIFKVGSYELNPLTSMKKGQILPSDDVEAFLSKCFESETKKRPSAKLLLTNSIFH